MTTQDRRTFLGTVVAGMVAARASFAASLKAVGVQLYTVRTDLEKDFDGTLATIAAIGYKEVEFAGYFGRTPQQVRETLKTNGLVSPAAHIDYPTVSDPAKWAMALDDAATLGQTFLVNPWIDEAVRNQPDAWKRAADVYNTAGAAAQKHGIQFCYHNHNFEFYPRQDLSGALPFEYLLATCDPTLVKMELDLCWISAASKDPLAYFQKYPGRFPLVHVKGLKAVPAASPTPVAIDKVLPDVTEVGHDDVIDWKRIFAQSKEAGIAHYFVEHDVPKVPLASLEESYQYLAKLQF
ncbi:MAG TPA: sugar phosphate isomerase/epimerase [Vicinamibacterales bacterium]|jgi:sugar phosphate isomerase/epimerase